MVIVADTDCRASADWGIISAPTCTCVSAHTVHRSSFLSYRACSFTFISHLMRWVSTGPNGGNVNTLPPSPAPSIPQCSPPTDVLPAAAVAVDPEDPRPFGPSHPQKPISPKPASSAVLSSGRSKEPNRFTNTFWTEERAFSG